MQIILYTHLIICNHWYENYGNNFMLNNAHMYRQMIFIFLSLTGGIYSYYMVVNSLSMMPTNLFFIPIRLYVSMRTESSSFTTYIYIYFEWNCNQIYYYYILLYYLQEKKADPWSLDIRAVTWTNCLQPIIGPLKLVD